jgi:hypothetical protein
MLKKGKIYFYHNTNCSVSCEGKSKNCFGNPVIVFEEIGDRILCTEIFQLLPHEVEDYSRKNQIIELDFSDNNRYNKMDIKYLNIFPLRNEKEKILDLDQKIYFEPVIELRYKKDLVFDNSLPEVAYDDTSVKDYLEKHKQLINSSGLENPLDELTENKNIAMEVFAENKDDYEPKLTREQFEESPVAKTFQTGLILPNKESNELKRNVYQENRDKRNEAVKNF